jgi:hypothetical protein
MYRLFGKTEGHACRECSNLVKVRVSDRPLTKCKVYGETPSEASDWVQRYQACGMFNKPWDKQPIIRQVKPIRTKQDEAQRLPLDGQITMEV